MINRIIRILVFILLALLLVGCNGMDSTSSGGDVYTVKNVQELTQVQKQAGFDLTLPQNLPENFKFDQVSYQANQQAITVQYVWFDPAFSGEKLSLTQQQIKPDNFEDLKKKGEAFILGNVWGWFVQGDTILGRWQPAAPVYSILWEAHDYYFTLQFSGNDIGSAGYLDKQELYDLALQLIW